jgi:hypothetical protein
MATYSDLNIEFYILEDSASNWSTNKRAQMGVWLTDELTLAYTESDGATSYYALFLDTNFDSATSIRHLTLNSAGSVRLGAAKGRLVFTDAATDTAQFLTCYVSIGNITPESELHIWRATAGDISADANALAVLENSSTTYFQFLVPDDATAAILWTHPTAGKDAAIDYDATTSSMSFTTANTSWIYITSAGYIGVHTDAPDTWVHIYDGNSGLGAPVSGTLFTLEAATDSDAYISILNPSGEGYDSGLIIGQSTTNDASFIYDGYANEIRINVKTGGNVDLQVDDVTKFYVDSSGDPHIVGANLIYDTERTITNADDAGTVGTVCHDDDYIYVCITANTWKRVAIGTW